MPKLPERVKRDKENKFKLSREIISRSEADDWRDAKHEWTLVGIYFADSPGTCLCGHSPINECCVLENRFNGLEVVVGNSCVNKFLNLPSSKLFAAVKRIGEGIECSPNEALIDFAFEKRWINDYERSFLNDTKRKRQMTTKQMAWRVRLNRALLYRVSQGGM